MFQNKTDQDWEFFGKNDPYYGVVTWEKFRSDRLNPELKSEFFATGQAYVDSIVGVIKNYINPQFFPCRGLDFGCGVGRLVIPFASVCKNIVGVDVSASMLKEASKNSQDLGIKNIQFFQGDDCLSNLSGKFDFIHSFIVFQHIPINRGEAIAEKLIELLQEGGIGVLHFTYFQNLSQAHTVRDKIYQALPLLWSLRNKIKGKPPSPKMEMNCYDLNQLFRILQEQNCHHTLVRFTKHGAFDGVIIFFRKEALPML
jgi:SAM-dependent methyltransferase